VFEVGVVPGLPSGLWGATETGVASGVVSTPEGETEDLVLYGSDESGPYLEKGQRDRVKNETETRKPGTRTRTVRPLE